MGLFKEEIKEIISVIRKNDADSFLEIIQTQNISPDSVDKHGISLIEHAATYGSDKVFNKLMLLGASVENPQKLFKLAVGNAEREPFHSMLCFSNGGEENILKTLMEKFNIEINLESNSRLNTALIKESFPQLLSSSYNISSENIIQNIKSLRNNVKKENLSPKI